LDGWSKLADGEKVRAKGKGRKMKTKDFLKKHDACLAGARWALSISDDMADVWNAMIEHGKHEWLVWTVTSPNVFTDSVLRKLACRFVRETPLADGRKIWDLLTDERSRRAVEVAERYADGKATAQELEDAYSAADAARAAAFAATEAVARAALAATDAADAAADDAVYAAYAATDAVAYAATDAAACAATDAAACAARAAAKAAQVRMIAELGNPFK
jgi:hypothetical protein